MRWFIASDIHGSAYYCRKMLEAYEREACGRMVLLGDILYHGPRNDLPREYDPRQVIDLLGPLSDQIYCVRGNCEAEVDQMVLSFPVMADYMLLPAGEEGERLVYVTHGHIYNENKLPPLRKGDVLLHGHTHVPKCTEHETYVYMNPGSVSIPKEDSWHGYMILEKGRFTWKDLDGHVRMEYVLEP